MTTPDKILADLLISQSTCDALAERMHCPMLAIRAMCERHERDGLLEQFKIAECVIVWRLTDNGREVATTLSPAVAANPFATAS
jgi:hypothetical protein